MPLFLKRPRTSMEASEAHPPAPEALEAASASALEAAYAALLGAPTYRQIAPPAGPRRARARRQPPEEPPEEDGDSDDGPCYTCASIPGYVEPVAPPPAAAEPAAAPAAAPRTAAAPAAAAPPLPEPPIDDPLVDDPAPGIPLTGHLEVLLGTKIRDHANTVGSNVVRQQEAGAMLAYYHAVLLKAPSQAPAALTVTRYRLTASGAAVHEWISDKGRTGDPPKRFVRRLCPQQW